MGDIRFRCPGCGAKHKADESLAGLTTNCAECKVEMTIPAVSTVPPPKGLVIPAPAPAPDLRIKELENRLAEREAAAAERTRQNAELTRQARTLSIDLERTRADIDARSAEAAKAVVQAGQSQEEFKKQNAGLAAEVKALRDENDRLKAGDAKTRADMDLLNAAVLKLKGDLTKSVGENGKQSEELKRQVAAQAAENKSLRDEKEQSLAEARKLRSELDNEKRARAAEAKESAVPDEADARLAAQAAEMTTLREEKETALAENRKLRTELEGEKRMRLAAGEKTEVPREVAAQSSRAIDDLKRQYAALTFDLKARAEELVKVKAERDNALAMARQGGEGATKQVAEQLSALHERVEALERIRADQEKGLSEYKRRVDELTKENNSLNNRMRTFAQALRYKT